MKGTHLGEEDLHGDLTEFFERNVQARGAFIARLIYVMSRHRCG